MRLRFLRPIAALLAAALLGVPAAQAAVVFKGFSAKRERVLRSDLAKSAFPFSALLDVVVKPGDPPEGALGLAASNGLVILDEDAFASDEVRTFALLHELSHQLDYQVLEDAERGLYYEAAGFGSAGGGRVEPFVPPMPPAPVGRPLPAPDPAVAPVATSLAAVEPLSKVSRKRHSVLRVRLAASLGALPDAPLLLDVPV